MRPPRKDYQRRSSADVAAQQDHAQRFRGWIVERAVNIPREWPSEYHAAARIERPGEEPNRGGLLVARYGEGAYIYNSLAMRRQLLAGNAGAIECLPIWLVFRR